MSSASNGKHDIGTCTESQSKGCFLKFSSHSELPNNCHKIIHISSSPLASINVGRCILSQSKECGPKNFSGDFAPRAHSSLSPLNLPWPRRHAAVAVMTNHSVNHSIAFSVSKLFVETKLQRLVCVVCFKFMI